VLQQCAALLSRLWSHVEACTQCVRRAIQHTCIAHARSHTDKRERGHIHPCIRVCRHTKYKHACIQCTYIYLHSSAQRNSIYHAQMCPTTTHSCEQAMYCTYSSVWSVELWASAAAMCCAPSAPMEVQKRLHAHVCVRRTIQHHVRSSRCATSHIQPRARSYTPVHTCMSTYKIQAHVHVLHVYLPSFQSTKHISCINVPHYYALMRAGYVLHSLECLKRGVVGKCCSNVLRSLRVYGVAEKAARTCV
jgi:hypothetical protein